MPRRFHWIDSLRGLAALAVLLAHYPHFYLTDPAGHHSLPAPGSLPFAALFSGVYQYGHLAVPLFWMISGFVFLHVYRTQPPTARSFAIARIARLYPMHFATLIAVALIQITSLQLTGQSQIYGQTDLTHFLLNLAFASHWTTQSHGLSFNGPIWSVSLEIVVYAMFFVVVSLGKLRSGWAMLALALAAGLASTMGQENLPVLRIGVLKCASYFFAGAALYTVVLWSRPAAMSLAVICALLAGLRLGLRLDMASILMLGAALILIAALLDTANLPAPRPLRHLGDISYSLYLVHVPVQMICLLSADLWFDGSRSFADAALTLPVYVVMSVTLAAVTHRVYERPANHAVRRWLSVRSTRASWMPPLAERSS